MKLLAVNYFRRKAASQKLNWVRKTSDCADNELIVFRIQSNIYNEAFSRELLSQKNCITEIELGSKDVSAYKEVTPYYKCPNRLF